MTNEEFRNLRHQLNKTQKQMSQLLGVSLKAVHSYEQGWRNIPPAVERQMFFLLSRKKNRNGQPCWKIKKCPPEVTRRCPAWEFKAGKLCWFINGTICDGGSHAKWEDKMKICRTCPAFNHML